MLKAVKASPDLFRASTDAAVSVSLCKGFFASTARGQDMKVKAFRRASSGSLSSSGDRGIANATSALELNVVPQQQLLSPEPYWNKSSPMNSQYRLSMPVNPDRRTSLIVTPSGTSEDLAIFFTASREKEGNITVFLFPLDSAFLLSGAGPRYAVSVSKGPFGTIATFGILAMAESAVPIPYCVSFFLLGEEEDEEEDAESVGFSPSSERRYLYSCAASLTGRKWFTNAATDTYLCGAIRNPNGDFFLV
mmetsp:Transcript_16131/g.32675  ORF Transcript_16131/g.32675 Transcript_16131/m.32675 type:complete len:249 (-) Transcript_16131:220-966(-)